MNAATDISLTTEEGHAVTLSRRDFDTLSRWPRLDMTRLLVVGEDAVHARRIDGTVHPQSLEDLLATLKVPAVLKTPQAPAAAASEPRPSGLLAYFKQTGNARPSRGALAGKGGVKLPTVYVNGQPVLLKANTIEAGRVKLPVTAQASQDVVAWAYIPQADFETLRLSSARPDFLAWRMDADGTHHPHQGQPCRHPNAGRQRPPGSVGARSCCPGTRGGRLSHGRRSVRP